MIKDSVFDFPLQVDGVTILQFGDRKFAIGAGLLTLRAIASERYPGYPAISEILRGHG
jgi:hypothetical protein